MNLIMGVFTLANTFIALFIVVYAFLFLKKTKSHKERRPWDYLFVASFIYLIYTALLMLVEIYNVRIVMEVNIFELSVFFQFIYTGLILLSFISQTDLIFKNDLIIIMKKLRPEDKEKILDKINIGRAEDIVIKRDNDMIKKEMAKVEEALEEDIKEEVREEIKDELLNLPDKEKVSSDNRLLAVKPAPLKKTSKKKHSPKIKRMKKRR